MKSAAAAATPSVSTSRERVGHGERASRRPRVSATTSSRRRGDATRAHGEGKGGRRAFLSAATVSLALGAPSFVVVGDGRDGVAAARTELLSERLSEKKFPKQVFASSRPGTMTYPGWLEGEWLTTTDFAGYEFPSKLIDKGSLTREATTPGFQKLSLAYVPDVGRDTTRYRMRFTRGGKRENPVTEDRVFNLTEIINAYIGEDAVEEVEYDGLKDPNRATIRLKHGVSNNAERIELFTNARESETRQSDQTFFASETLRQVTLGYSTSYGVARMVPTDYTHVWTYTPLPDVDSGSVDEQRVGQTDSKVVNRVKVTLSTAGYLQPNDALKYTARPTSQNGVPSAPVPQVGAASALAFEPVVLYSHVMLLERVGCVP
jgi:hypothetical protein